MIVPVANEAKLEIPPRYMPAMATITVKPEIRHRATRGRGRGLDRGVVIASGGALFTRPLQIEEAVVDTDGHADEQDDVHDRSIDRRDLADRAEQTQRRAPRW